MARKTILCNSCDASYTVSFEMDEGFYTPNYCPFCGEEIIDAEYNIDENEEEE
tara:strand:+ start:518 stop:676 length:159 start_codon:yes stop_codon:yes gene_type:complete